MANQLHVRGLSQGIDIEVSTPIVDAFSKNTIRAFAKLLHSKKTKCRIVNLIRFYKKAHAMPRRGYSPRRV